MAGNKSRFESDGGCSEGIEGKCERDSRNLVNGLIKKAIGK
jgi:hypothetical protein